MPALARWNGRRGTRSEETLDSSALSTAELRALRDGRVAVGDWQGAAEAALEIVDATDCTALDLRITSGILSQCDRMTDALPIAVLASQGDPNNAEYAQHAGCISNQCGDYAGSIPHLLRSRSLDRGNAETHLQLAIASERLGDLPTATELAHEAYRLDPQNHHRGMMLAHLLALQKKLPEAVDITRSVIESAGPDPHMSRSLAHLLQQVGDLAGALAAIDSVIAGHPNCADCHGIRAILLLQLGRVAEADLAFRRALELDPAKHDHMRHAVSVLIEKNDVAGALRYGGQLLAIAPADAEYASCMRHLLEVQSMNAQSSDFSGIAQLKVRAPARRQTQSPGFRKTFENQWRIIVALILRDIRTRYSESRLGFLWVLMEPIVHVGVLAIVFQFTMQGRPPMGSNFFLFYFTGVMPYLLLNHLALRVGTAVKDSRSLLSISSIVPMDLLISKSLVEIFVTAVVFFIFIGLFHVFGVDGTPVAPELVFVAFAITWILGTGIGLICAALFRLGMIVETALSVLLRLLYFTSGIFYVPANLPLFARDILVWNPFLHVIDLMRVGFFRGYQPPWNDAGYALEISIIVLLCGFVAIAVTSRRLRVWQ